ncbi:hypothetical protein OUZ56_021971 [Daphnia magna]|uniref:Uncharacterized protein n=1 Tax=Daphnia magna TaxID=35525 RepID=A0ABR0AV11_9CRUS|nr:hypothetical protein OUZ56_021971 [Daphnia magna]
MPYKERAEMRFPSLILCRLFESKGRRTGETISAAVLWTKRGSPGAEEFDTLSTENQVWSAANGAITPPDAHEVGVKYRIDMTSNNIKDQTIFFGAKCKPDQGV